MKGISMQILNGKKLWLLAVTLALSASVATAQQSRPVNDAALKSAAKHGEEWLSNDRDYAATRYSPLKQIDTTNVSRLGLAWYYDTGSLPGTVEATPIVSNGTLYATVTWGVVFALDAKTGKEKWRWDPKIGTRISRRDPRESLTGFARDRVFVAAPETVESPFTTGKSTSAR